MAQIPIFAFFLFIDFIYFRVPIRRGVRNKRSGTQDEKCIGRNISHMWLGLYDRCRFIVTNLHLKVLHFDILIQLKGTAHFLENVLCLIKRSVPNKRTVSSNWNTRVAINNLVITTGQKIWLIAWLIAPSSTKYAFVVKQSLKREMKAYLDRSRNCWE